jgi:hypothetical protein
VRNVLDSVKNNLGNGLSLYSKITGKDFVSQVEPKANSISVLFDMVTSDIDEVISALLNQFDQGGYYIFFDCTDRAGNRNKDQIFIRFIVDQDYADNEAPVIVQTEPGNNGRISPSLDSTMLKIYVDEPAECRYDFFDTDYSLMANSFSCPALEYETSPVAGGTYECTADIALPNADNYLFIRCADNPPLTDEYPLRLYDSDNDSIQISGNELNNDLAGIDYASPFDYLSITGNELSIPADMLDEFSFKTNLSQIMLNIYIDDKKQCRVSGQEENFDDMENIFNECVISEDITKGVYKCSVLLDRMPETQAVNDAGISNESNESNQTSDSNSTQSNAAGPEAFYHIKCRAEINNTRNVNQEGYFYKISKADELIITKVTPEGVVNTTKTTLSVKVSGDILQSEIQCGYNDNPYIYLRMPRSGKDTFQIDLPELEQYRDYTYYIECTDKYGSRIDKTLKFKAIK